MDNFFKSTNIIKLLLNWKWHLLIIISSAIVLSIVFSGPYFIKPKYKSYAVIYPSNIAPYSTENNTEQMLQLLKSEDLLFNIARKFNLNVEYKIDSTDKYYHSEIIQRLGDNISIKKTEYESVLIEVYDNNPVQACNMVKEFINEMNLEARKLQRDKTAEVVKIEFNQMISKKRQIDSIENRMQYLRKEYNILDYNIQVKEYSKGFVKLGGHESSSSPISLTLDNLKQYGGEYRMLNLFIEDLIKSFNTIKADYDKSISDMNKELTYASIVTNPIPADEKAYPIRWLIVTVTTLSAFLLSIMLFLLIGMRKNKSEQKIQ